MSNNDGNGMVKKNDESENNSVPSFHVLAQYIKDLSFENPHAPKILFEEARKSSINVDIKVHVEHLAEENYEVSLEMQSKAMDKTTVIFNTEIIYAGVFKIANIPPENIKPLLFIECPRLLFPFIRQIISDITHYGGYPPLLIDPINFAALYQKKMSADEENKSKQMQE